jgi:transcriptional regulator with XRE-family HTH domain
LAKSPDPVDKYAGARVRMQRLTLGMSQTQLADAIGLTFQQVQKYEKGTNRMGSSRLQQIADVLQVPVAFFFEAQVRPPRANASPPDYVSKFLGMRDGHRLARSFVAIKSSKVRDIVVEIAALLAGTTADRP